MSVDRVLQMKLLKALLQMVGYEKKIARNTLPLAWLFALLFP